MKSILVSLASQVSKKKAKKELEKQDCSVLKET